MSKPSSYFPDVSLAMPTLRAMPRFFENAHFCKLPSTVDLIGQEMDFTCWDCEARFRLEYYLVNGGVVGPSWVPL